WEIFHPLENDPNVKRGRLQLRRSGIEPASGIYRPVVDGFQLPHPRAQHFETMKANHLAIEDFYQRGYAQWDDDNPDYWDNFLRRRFGEGKSKGFGR
ncbi:MAG: hypothetical protein AAGJ35_09920, partial [Myxococcota bacterium]